MIAYLKGTILAHTSQGAIVQSGDIGYDCIGGWLHGIKIDDSVELYCYHYLENQSMPRLLAVSSLKARSLVISLLDVPGVGPKMAGRILDHLKPDSLIAAITAGDLDTLGQVKGLGKKTAQKIILELGKTLVLDSSSTSPYSEALLSLGFTKSEVETVLKNTDVTGLTESQALSALMRNLGSHHDHK
ncbi:MAG: Holliday junction branch migration protein RuvA [Candidatus Microgenomates bacterium]